MSKRRRQLDVAEAMGVPSAKRVRSGGVAFLLDCAVYDVRTCIWEALETLRPRLALSRTCRALRDEGKRRLGRDFKLLRIPSGFNRFFGRADWDYWMDDALDAVAECIMPALAWARDAKLPAIPVVWDIDFHRHPLNLNHHDMQFTVKLKLLNYTLAFRQWTHQHDARVTLSYDLHYGICFDCMDAFTVWGRSAHVATLLYLQQVVKQVYFPDFNGDARVYQPYIPNKYRIGF